MSALNVTQAARMVAETELLTIKQVAAKYETSGQTVRNHLDREAKGQQEGADARLVAFAQACAKEREAYRAEAERRRTEWADVAVSSLRSLLETLGEAAKATSKDISEGKLEKGRIRELAGAVKIIGELSLGGRALFGGPRTHRPDPPAAEAPGGVRDPGPDPVH